MTLSELLKQHGIKDLHGIIRTQIGVRIRDRFRLERNVKVEKRGVRYRKIKYFENDYPDDWMQSRGYATVNNYLNVHRDGVVKYAKQNSS